MTPTPEQNAKRFIELSENVSVLSTTETNAVILAKAYLNLETELQQLRLAADGMAKTLSDIALKQPAILDIIQRNGFVFTDIGREPGNWQHLAFTIYTSLCEVDQTTKAALEAYRAAGDGSPKDTGTSKE